MASLYSVCNEITTTETKSYLIGNNIIPIEAFESIAAYNLATPSTDQNAIVLIKSDNITIDLGQTLTVANPKKSLVLFCDTLTNNGTISMTGKGPNVLPHEYVIIQNDTVFEDVVIPAYANNRLERKYNAKYIANGTEGNNGANRDCGSGGQGAATASNSGSDPYRGKYKALGASGSGYAFGGGAGSGGKSGNSSLTYEEDIDVNPLYPMIGAPGKAYTYYAGSGGVGVISGTGEYKIYYNHNGQNGVIQDQNTGVGGRIIIFCNNFINNGAIEANGVAAYSSDMYGGASGGSSGGGAVDIFYFDLTTQGVITANGGASGDILGYIYIATPDQGGITKYNVPGGKGGDGSVTVSQLNSEIIKQRTEKTIFNYTGAEELITLTRGIYEITCAGAQGRYGYRGNLVKGILPVTKTATYKAKIGQQPLNNSGGWPDGKDASNIQGLGGGGSTTFSTENNIKLLQSAGRAGSDVWRALAGQSVLPTKIGSSGAFILPTGNFTIPPIMRIFTLNSGTMSVSFSPNKNSRKPKIYIRDENGTILATSTTSSSDYANLSFVVEAGRMYIIDGYITNYADGAPTIYWSVACPESIILGEVDASGYMAPIISSGGGTGGIDYADTVIQKANYANYSNIGNGYLAIRFIGEIILKPAIIPKTYYYDGQIQEFLLTNLDENKMTVTNNKIITAGTYTVKIKPKAGYYAGYYWEDGTTTEIAFSWTINKADPEVAWPVASPIELNDAIAESDLLDGIGSGAFNWSDDSQKTDITLPGYEVTFTPTDLTNYNILKNIISIEIILPNRLNSNIYKNIFAEEPIDVSIVNNFILDTIISVESIKQDNHGFSVNDVLYFDGERYQKAIAENSERAIVAGVVSKVQSDNVFTLMDSGIIEWPAFMPADSSFLYLSDEFPGQLVPYIEILNTAYIPVAVYIDNKIIINLQQGSFGDVMTPYQTQEVPLDAYTQEELDDISSLIITGVSS